MTDKTAPALRAENVTFGFTDRPDFLKPLSLKMRPGECWGIVGPNGAGKSTFLRLLAGLWTPSTGDLWLEDRRLADVTWRQRAKQMAFLPQQLAHDLSIPAGEIVLMGRYPHRRFGLFDNASDRKIAMNAMTTTQTVAFLDRPLRTLSGGEIQRVYVAAALAQQPTVFLLDEPTASLDLYYQLSTFELLRKLAVTDRLLVIVVTHDLNLASRFCTNVLLLNDGRQVAAGTPENVLTPEVLKPVYNVELANARVDDVGKWLVPLTQEATTGHVRKDEV